MIDNEGLDGRNKLLQATNTAIYVYFCYENLPMALFSQNIIYKSSFNTGEVLKRVADAVETKGITHIEYWTEPAKFFRGKVIKNTFFLTYTGNNRSINPDIEGTVQQLEESSIIRVKISYPGSLYTLVILFALAILLTLKAGIAGGLICASTSIPVFLFSIISYKWKSNHIQVLLEEIFQVKGEEQ